MRERVIPFVAALMTGLLGYGLRFYAPVPGWLRDASGGVAYVIFWMFAAVLVKPASAALQVSITVLALTCGIEFLQLWHPAWLEQIRRTLPGRLILGTTFDWLDFPPYLLGAILGWNLLRVIRPRK